MPETESQTPRPPSSKAVSRRRTRISFVWVVPIVAAVVGAWVAATRILGQGPEITIQFDSAEGLEAGKTKIHYNGVDVGTVTTIRLTEDHKHVLTTAQMAPKTESFLVKDTTFWVVRPRISGANVSGLGTLISGSYIGMEIGDSKESERHFVALETEPVVTGDVPGRFFVLKSPELGSLDTGTPVFFRRLQVGQVSSYSLDKDGKSLSIKVFVRAPYDQYVTPNTRFWQASGIDVSLTATGLSVQTQSLLSILIGGIAFETPATGPVLPPAEADTGFQLFNTRADAFKPPVRDPHNYLLIFTDSVRGLTAGAPVEMRGIRIGEVTDVSAKINLETFEFTVPVLIQVDPMRLGVQAEGLMAGKDAETIRREFIETLISRGARAQLRSGNLLTGALYVAIDVFPDSPPVKLDWSKEPVQLPTVPGEVEAIEANVVSIIKKLDKLPYAEIAGDLRKALTGFQTALDEFDATLASARTTLDGAGKLISPNSALDQELTQTLQELSRAARGLRVLADYLERHPEALIRGKTEETK